MADPITVDAITVPESVYYDALDPQCSGMAAEIGLPEPVVRRWGAQRQFIYRGVTYGQAMETADYLSDRAETQLAQFSAGDSYDPDVRRDRRIHRAAIAAAGKMRLAARLAQANA